MQKPKRGRKPRSSVVPIQPEDAGNVAVAEAEPETPFDPAPSAESSPPAIAQPTPQKRSPNFFERANAIPKAEWGVRAFIYVYCLEPICNLKMGGETKYLVRLSEPVPDENFLMVDYGSGKYRLQLVHRKAGFNNADAIDTKEVEIYTPKYPPKIPRTVWMNDPRNERWKALLPKEEPPQPQTGLGTLTDAFKTFGEIRRDLKEEMAPPPAPPGQPPIDPMVSSLRMVETIMAMKADNPMVEIMKLQLQSVNDQAEKAREREAGLQREMRELMVKLSERKPEQSGGGLKGVLTELKEFMPAIKDLLPSVTESARATHSNGWDILRDVAPDIAKGLFGLVNILASRMPSPPPQAPHANGQPPAALPAPQANGQPPQQSAPQPQGPPPNIPKFVQFLAQPLAFDSFRRYFEGFKQGDGQTGTDFAQWVFDGGGQEPLKEARAMGSANIMTFLKQTAAWVFFKDDEAKLVEFVDQALAWAPPPDDDDDEDDEAVDLTAKGV